MNHLRELNAKILNLFDISPFIPFPYFLVKINTRLQTRIIWVKFLKPLLALFLVITPLNEHMVKKAETLSVLTKSFSFKNFHTAI